MAAVDNALTGHADDPMLITNAILSGHTWACCPHCRTDPNSVCWNNHDWPCPTCQQPPQPGPADQGSNCQWSGCQWADSGPCPFCHRPPQW